MVLWEAYSSVPHKVQWFSLVTCVSVWVGVPCIHMPVGLSTFVCLPLSCQQLLQYFDWNAHTLTYTLADSQMMSKPRWKWKKEKEKHKEWLYPVSSRIIRLIEWTTVLDSERGAVYLWQHSPLLSSQEGILQYKSNHHGPFSKELSRVSTSL